jgi:uncharacterized phage protein gp47/JayE
VANQADISTQIIQALAASEPDLDTTIGSVSRKIIDAVASAISDVSLDNQMLTYQYDIDSKTGADLDTFVALFGMTRYPAARATGTVTFNRASSSDVISIAINSQVATGDLSVTVQTLATIIMGIGDLSVDAPVQAVVAGPDGNVASGTLTALETAVSEITSVSNLNALTGGTNQETDDQLRARWKATVFKSMAGTEQMFLGVALNDPDCQAANVVGASTRRREQLQIVSGAATSTVSDAQSVYPSGQIVGKDIDGGDVAAPGLQYTWNYGSLPPTITVIDATYFPDGTLFDLSFLYLDDASRNSLADGIFNRVDVWCAGTRAVAAAQSLAFENTTVFSSSPSNSFYTHKFVRPDGTNPVAANVFLQLAFGPIVTVPSTMVVDAVTYGLADATHALGSSSGGVTYAYQIVHRQGATGWSPYSDFGLEWDAGSLPPNGSSVVISDDYTYNQIPTSVQTGIEQWRLAGIDVLAHQGLTVQLQLSLNVIYDPSVSITVAQTAIQNALQVYLAKLGFNSRVYPSSVIQVVENTPGVVACRFTVGSDIAGYNGATPNAYNVGIQQLVAGVVTHSYVDINGDPTDIEFGDDTIPGFGATVLTTKAPNSFGSFA